MNISNVAAIHNTETQLTQSVHQPVDQSWNTQSSTCIHTMLYAETHSALCRYNSHSSL